MRSESRRGAMLIVAAVLLVGLLAATALSIDVGYIQVQKTRMQNGVDAAALAAAQEITRAISKAPPDAEDPTEFALSAARTTASTVAGMSGIYVDFSKDVTFGQRKFDAATNTWVTTWGKRPPNVIRVVARRDGNDPEADDAKLKLFFGGVIGAAYSKVQAEAISYVQSRDIAVVHDFSQSMNYDSHFASPGQQSVRMPDAQIVANMKMLWEDLNPNAGKLQFTPQYLTLSNTSNSVTTTCKFMYDSCYVTATTPLVSASLTFADGTVATTSFQGSSTRSATLGSGKDITAVKLTVSPRSSGSNLQVNFIDSDENVKKAFGLTGQYPYPRGSWDAFVSHCRNDSMLVQKGYRETYGGLCFVNYILRSNSAYAATPKLSRSRHYPFSAIKSGHEQLCDFLETLSFDDRLGMVSYDTNHRVETILNDTFDSSIPKVDISDSPLTHDYEAVNYLMKFKQGNYYSPSTNIGGGLKSAVSLLDQHARAGAQSTILLMTDGNSNKIDAGEGVTLPEGWNWDTQFDYDGNGLADYQSSSIQAQYVLLQAYRAAQKGHVIHTIAVGADADTALLKAVSWLGSGIHLHIQGGTSAAEMEARLLIAFQRIAAMVPPPKLLASEVP